MRNDVTKKLGGGALKRRERAKTFELAMDAMEEATAKAELGAEELRDSADGLNEVPADRTGAVVTVKDSDLVDDPLNEGYYGKLDGLENMAEAIKKYGFQGIILAYPTKNGKWTIQSGHRRRAAGRLAGMTEFPVLPTEAPATEWERKMRLFMGNLHSRREDPMTMARVTQGLFEAHREEVAWKKANGLLKDGEETYANALVAADLDVTTSLVEKYRALNRLSPELQRYADGKSCPWSELAKASTLDEERQRKLAEEIEWRLTVDGEESADRNWMKRTVRRLRDEADGVRKPEEVGAKERTRDDLKLLVTGSRNVRDAIEHGRPFTGRKRDEAIAELRLLRESVDAKLRELESGS